MPPLIKGNGHYIFRKMKVHEASYCAGLFDGEGSVGSYFSDGRRTIVASITMTDQEPLLRFAQYTGLLRVSGPYQHRSGFKPTYRWVTSNRLQVEQLYDEIKFWLSPRRHKQFEEAFNKYDEY